ncbi:MAG: 2-hydroxyacid dehydrogenase [Chloroflexota bacterium]
MKIFASCNMPAHWVERFSDEFEFDFHDWGATKTLLPQAQLIRRLQSCQILITEFDEVTAEVIEQLPDLIAIVDCRGNPVNIDIEAATRHNIIVMNTPGRNAVAVAEMTVALMVFIARGFVPAIKEVESGEWVRQGFKPFYLNHFGDEVANTTVGLVGLGAVARQVIQRLQGFKVRLLAYDPFITHEQVNVLGAERVELDELLQQSDFVSLHAPITPQTTGMIGSREFDLMKSSAYLINTARAVLVDETALIDALVGHKIAGAGLDVFHEEPLPSDYPLLGNPNVIAIPHLGGATNQIPYHHSEIAFNNIQQLLNRSPINVVNPDVVEQSILRL